MPLSVLVTKKLPGACSYRPVVVKGNGGPVAGNPWRCAKM
jgi:hypothetical protein